MSEDLVVYAPLTEGFRYPFKLFNFKSGTSFILTGSISWQEQQPLLICPSFTIYSYDQNSCLVEDFVKLSQDTSHIVNVMKGQSDETNFTV